MKVKVIILGLNKKEINKINNILRSCDLRMTKKGKVLDGGGFKLEKDNINGLVMCMSIATNAKLIDNDYNIIVSKGGNILLDMSIDQVDGFVWDTLGIYEGEGYNVL